MPRLSVLHGKKNIPALGLETKKKGDPGAAEAAPRIARVSS